MIDFDVLRAFNTTNERLKEIMTAVPEKDIVPARETKEEREVRHARLRKTNHDLSVRERLRRETQTRVEEGIVNSLRNWKLYAAVDLAWDTTVISGMTLPLMMYAQKKISVERAAELLSSTSSGKEFVKRSEGGKIEVDVPRFIETNINFVRSFVTRRHAAQVNKFNQLWPYYKYEARSTGLVAKCRADVLSQRMDMMVDQFGYRHHDAQVMRDAFLYAHSVDFVQSSWDKEEQYERKDFNGKPDDVRTVIVKEGVRFFNPSPSRVYWDNSAPNGLASINDDDMQWIGFWDVIRFSEIDDNPHYFNKQAVGWTGRFWGDAGVYNTYKDYFTHYQYTIIPPSTGEIDPSKANDRKSVVGFYSGNQRDASVFVSHHFRHMVPKDWGIGEYPWPVWIRFVTASDSTCIFAEILPSTPAAYLGINENDSRQVNVSMAMNLLSYQDQMTNLVTQLMLVCQMELFKIVGINSDLVTAEQIAAIRKIFKGHTWLEEPTIIEYSLAKMKELGINVEKLIEFHEAHMGATIESIFKAMIQLVQLVERLEALSPNEQGQPAPREISATEVNEISNTTSSVYSFISEGIDEFRAAKKRICYESLIACSKGDIVCPVKDRYTAKTIKAAGFDTKKDEDEDYNSPVPGKPRRVTVIGSKRNLIHDYIFTTRDGSERPVNTQSANTLVQLIGQVLAVPAVAQAMGKEKLYELFNEVFRLSGAGVDLNLTLKEGEDDSLGQDDMTMLKQQFQQLVQHLQQMAGQLQQNAQDIQQIEAVEKDQQQFIQHAQTLAVQVKKLAEDVQTMHDHKDEISKRLAEMIDYAKAPPSVKRQIEDRAGLTPATQQETELEMAAMKPQTKTAAPK